MSCKDCECNKCKNKKERIECINCDSKYPHVNNCDAFVDINTLPNIKDNLHRPIKDCELNSKNEMTYLEFMCYGYASINSPLSAEKILEIMKMSNEELNEILEELDYLMEK